MLLESAILLKSYLKRIYNIGKNVVLAEGGIIGKGVSLAGAAGGFTLGRLTSSSLAKIGVDLGYNLLVGSNYSLFRAVASALYYPVLGISTATTGLLLPVVLAELASYLGPKAYKAVMDWYSNLSDEEKQQLDNKFKADLDKENKEVKQIEYTKDWHENNKDTNKPVLLLKNAKEDSVNKENKEEIKNNNDVKEKEENKSTNKYFFKFF